MTDTRSDNLAGDLLRIHAAITRGIDIAMERRSNEGAGLFEESLYATIETHHRTEDEASFPFFRDKLPEVPYDELAEDHRKLTSLVERKDIVNLKELWIEHIGKEEGFFTQERLDALLGPEEQARHRIQVGQVAGRHSQPPFLVMPFALFNLTEEERQVFARNLPPEVLKMVETEWQDRWQPMRELFYGL